MPELDSQSVTGKLDGWLAIVQTHPSVRVAVTAAAKTAVIAAAAAEAKAAVAAAGIVAVVAQAAEFSTTAAVVQAAAVPPASWLGLEPLAYWPYPPH